MIYAQRKRPLRVNLFKDETHRPLHVVLAKAGTPFPAFAGTTVLRF